MPQIQFGTAGRFGILEQTGFEVPQTNDNLFHYLPFTGGDFGPQQQQGALPPEAGGQTKSLPRGIFKSGVLAMGGLEIIPRLYANIGYWLKCLCGNVSSYVDQTIAQVIAGVGATAGVDSHLFGFVDMDDFDIPYFTAHRYLPNTTAGEDYGEIFQDCRMLAMTLDGRAANIVTGRFDMVGRALGTPWDKNPGWAEPTYDDDSTFMVTACAGQVDMSVSSGTPAALTSFDVLSARLTMANIIVPPDRMRVIGSPHPVDFPVTGRSISVDVVIYVDTYDQYVQTFAGPQAVVDDHGWSCEPLFGDVDIIFQSPAQIGATGEYHELRFLTDQGNVGWLSRPIILEPNQPVLLALRGTITEQDTGRDFELYIQNTHAAY